MYMFFEFQTFYIQSNSNSSLISIFLEISYLKAAKKTFKYGTTVLMTIIKNPRAQCIGGVLLLGKCFLNWIEGRSTVTIYTVINNNNGLFETPKIFSCVSKTPYESMGNRTVVEI